MDDGAERRIEDVRGDAADELRYLSHVALDRLNDALPPEFWRHAQAARREARAALLVLLRTLVDTVAPEEAGDAAPVSRQRGRIEVAESAPVPDGVAEPPRPAAPEQPSFAPGAKASRQRGRISLE